MKKLLSLILVLLLVALAALPASAAQFIDGDSDKAVNVDGSAFVAGQSPECGGDVTGIAFVAGYDVTISGATQYIAGAGYNVNVTGSATDDAFLAGYDVKLSGPVGRDVFAAGSFITVSGTVGGDIYAAAGSVVIDGTVSGDAYVSAEKITVTDNAVIVGTLHYDSSAEANIAPGSTVGNTDVTAAPVVEPAQVPDLEDNSIDWVGKLLGFIGLVALAFVLMWLTGVWEKLDSKYTGMPFGKFAAAFGIGLAVLVGVPVASVILFITRIGTRLALVMLFAYGAVLAMAPVFAGFFVGGLIWRKLAKKAPCYWAELPIGIFVCTLLGLIPYVGWLVSLVVECFGVGAVALLLGKPAAPAPLPLEEPQQSVEISE